MENQLNQQMNMALLQQSQYEILRLRKNLKHQANNEETVRELIDKLDKAFEELSSMNSRLIRYMEKNHGLQVIVSSLREENQAQKKLLESMDQQLRLANEAKIHKNKRFGRKSKTSKSLKLKDAKIGEMHYRKKYVWGIVNTVKKLVYYLYEEGSRARKVIGKSVSILGDLYSQIESLYHDKLTRYSDLLRKAINYAYHEWKAVVRYIENGNWSIDNNAVERRMKPVVLGRKNYMNYGSHQGASNGAYMYTLVESCKMNGTSPVAYIKYVLCSLIKGETDYLQLIPCNWVNNK